MLHACFSLCLLADLRRPLLLYTSFNKLVFLFGVFFFLFLFLICFFFFFLFGLLLQIAAASFVVFFITACIAV